MELAKSSRHSRITGDFGETLVLYWLSRYGFECAGVDHTGIDLLAKNPRTQELMGISVKSRSRNRGTERTPLNIRNDEFTKVATACRAFDCTPYFAIVIDAADRVRTWLLPMQHLRKISPPGRAVATWKMTNAALARYEADPVIKAFELKTLRTRWWD